jgi:hypothetical protein
MEVFIHFNPRYYSCVNRVIVYDLKDLGSFVGWYMYNLCIQHNLTDCRGGHRESCLKMNTDYSPRLQEQQQIRTDYLLTLRTITLFPYMYDNPIKGMIISFRMHACTRCPSKWQPRLLHMRS